MTNIAILLMSAAGVGTVPDNALLDFTASWCGPCRQMKPVVNELVRQGHRIVKIDVDRNPGLARKYGIRGIPAFVLVVNGKVVDRSVGYTSRQRLKRMLARIPEQPIAKKAEPTAKPVARPSEAVAKDRKAGRNRFRLPLPEFLSPRKKTENAVASVRKEQPVFRGNLDTQKSDPRDLQRSLGSRFPESGDASPMAASVRIRVRDGDGHSVGSGTVIDSRPGRSIVLSCGHVFRGLKQRGAIEVDVFHNGRGTTFNGTLLKHNMKADVGLLSIDTPEPIPTVDLAKSSEAPRKGDAVYNIGCPGGSKPSRLKSRVTALNRYLGPDNLECLGAPKQGRSGGGLFDSAGRLVGVCFAADPPRNRGLYAGLKAIRNLIEQAGVKLTEPTDEKKDSPEATVLASAAQLELDRGQLEQMRAGGSESRSADSQSAREKTAPPSRSADRPSAHDEVDPFEQALASLDANKDVDLPLARSNRDVARSLQTVDEVFGGDGEAEVVCIIRPLNNPQAASRIVVINRASSKFVRYLRNELDSQPRPTSQYQPNRSESPRFEEEELVSPFQAVAKSRPVSPPARYRRSAASR